MSPEPSTEIQKLKERDPRQMELVFNQVNPYLFKLLAAQRVSGPVAQDLIQSAWTTFFESLDRFEGRSQLKVFVAGILINKVRENRRSEQRFLSEEDLEGFMDSAFTTAGWWKKDVASPEQDLNSKQSLSSIQHCLEQLPESQRTAFILREVQELETEEICKILDISVSHLGVLIFRAKETLRKSLRDWAGGTLK